MWYKRAVEQHYVQPGSFVFSIPIDDDGANNETLVTASRAVFVGRLTDQTLVDALELFSGFDGDFVFLPGNDSMRAPAAVVGFQMTHTAFQGLFKKIAFSCNGAKQCERHCGDNDTECYLVDNHGYIVAAKDPSAAGLFLGAVHGLVMNSLVEREVFEKIAIFDYQAVCFRGTQETNDGSVLLTVGYNFLQILSYTT